MTPDEKVAFYTKQDEHLQTEIAKAKHELETFLKAQHDVRRNLFNAWHEQRHPNG